MPSKKNTSKKPDPVTLILGDPFLTEEKAKDLIATIQEQKKEKQVQVTQYRLGEADLEIVLAEARALPFLVDFQILYLKQVEVLKDKKIELLESYLQKPSETTILIMEGDSLDRRSAIVKLIEKKGALITIDDREKKTEGAKFIAEQLKNAGKTMPQGLVRRICEQAGDSPSVLESIVNQLITYAGSEKQITEEMVAKCEEDWQEVDVFQLVNAIAAKNSGQALIFLKGLIGDSPSEVIGLLGILHWQLRRFWLAKALLTEGRSDKVVLQRLKISPAQASYFLRQVKSFKRETLERALENLFQLDWKSKTGRAEPVLEMERWVVSVTS